MRRADVRTAAEVFHIPLLEAPVETLVEGTVENHKDSATKSMDLSILGSG